MSSVCLGRTNNIMQWLWNAMPRARIYIMYNIYISLVTRKIRFPTFQHGQIRNLFPNFLLHHYRVFASGPNSRNRVTNFIAAYAQRMYTSKKVLHLICSRGLGQILRMRIFKFRGHVEMVKLNKCWLCNMLTGSQMIANADVTYCVLAAFHLNKRRGGAIDGIFIALSEM